MQSGLIWGQGTQSRAALPTPIKNDMVRLETQYLAYHNGKLISVDDAERPVAPLAEFVHDSFRALVLNPKFTCVAAKSAFNKDNYRFGIYEADMGSPEIISCLAQDLTRFRHEQDSLRKNGFSTFVASFTGPTIADESQFERLLWSTLQQLHNIDAPLHDWDASVSSDPEDPTFEFSLAGRAFFVVGMHPANTRWTRRFAWPTLVFNAHFQFEELRAEGKYGRMQQVMRTRDMALQGSINANLTDFGDRSDARQYAGRPVEADWHCPFHAQTRAEAARHALLEAQERSDGRAHVPGRGQEDSGGLRR